MISKRKIWTIEKCKEEALKYQHKVDFKKNSERAYTVLRKNGLLDESCKHMTKPEKSLLWTKEKCLEAALKCKTKSEFLKKFCGAYSSAKQHGWFDEIIQNFQPVGSKYNRCIYVCEFEDNHAYVGLTYNFEKRKKQHLSDNNSSVFKYIQLSGLEPFFKQVTEYLNYKDAAETEGKILNLYKNNGWIMLNRTVTGGLGSKDDIIARKWTEEKIIETAKQCETYSEFTKTGAYSAAKKHNMLPIIQEFLPIEYNPTTLGHRKWDVENSMDVFKKCNDLREFRENFVGAYEFLRKQDCWEELRKSIPLLQRDAWSFEEAHSVALKYDNKKDFRKNKPGCYSVCQQRGWLNEVCSHMRDLNKERIIYTESFVINILKDFEFMEQLKKSENKTIRGCYWWMKKHKKLIEYKKYLKETDIVTLWTDEKAYKELKKYDCYSEFRTNSNSCYQYFVRHKRLKEIKEYYEKIKL